jgi:hypothetical protein
MNSRVTVSRSHGVDRMIFGALVLILLCSAPRLRVYYRSTQIGATRVQLAAIDSTGARTAVAVPSTIQGHRVRATLAGIQAFANTTRARTLTPPAGHLEWTLRYSVGAGILVTSRTRIVTSGR